MAKLSTGDWWSQLAYVFSFFPFAFFSPGWYWPERKDGVRWVRSCHSWAKSDGTQDGTVYQLPRLDCHSTGADVYHRPWLLCAVKIVLLCFPFSGDATPTGIDRKRKWNGSSGCCQRQDHHLSSIERIRNTVRCGGESHYLCYSLPSIKNVAHFILS